MPQRTIDLTNVTDGSAGGSDHTLAADGMVFTIAAPGNWTASISGGEFHFAEDPTISNGTFIITITMPGNAFDLVNYSIDNHESPTSLGGFPTSVGVVSRGGTTAGVDDDSIGGVFTYESAFGNSPAIKDVASLEIYDSIPNGQTTSAAASFSFYNLTVDYTPMNSAPSGADKTIALVQDTHYTFATADFGFSDSDGNSLQAVEITTLPNAGTLTDNGVAVSQGQFVSAADIAAGNLVFTPAGGASGSGYGDFTFQVQDNGGTANGGVDTDPTARSMTLNVDARPTISSVVMNTAVINGNGTVSYTITFSEAVDMHTSALDIYYNTHTTGSAQLSSLTVNPLVGNTQVISFTATGDGTMSFSYPAGDVNAAGDPAATMASNYLMPSFTVDNTGPTVAITSDVPSLTAGQTATITFTFSDDPGGAFTSSDVTVAGGTLGAISGSGLTYTATFTPDAGIAKGVPSIMVAAAFFIDAAGNANTAGALSGLTYNTLTQASDFNGDFFSDLLWQNTTTGQLSIWEMDGLTPTGGKLGNPLGAGWNVIGTGDFNADNKSDILLQNSSTGQINVWLVNGHSLLPASGAIGNPGAGWKAVGIGDFNGDGHADIVLQNTATSQINIWLTDGAHILTGSGKVGTPGAGWQVVATGDFNGDGKSDLVLQNSATGQVNVWTLNGTQILSQSDMIGTPGADWKVLGAGDFNGDGTSDIVLQNSSTSQVSIWLMDSNAHVLSGSQIAKPGANWTVAGTGDFNDDGNSDILLQNSVTGQSQIWLMNGATILAGSGVVGASGPGANFHVSAG